jgi:hypothetical protein
VIVVVASRHDEAARQTVARWGPHAAALLTCEDLSTSGWRHFLFSQSESRVVVGGRVIPESAIRGVLVRRPWIFELELVDIAASDREYVAAEMNAFLLSWLSQVSCRVLNRPAGTCLCGPNWRPQQWARAAAQAGFAIQSVRWRVPSTAKQTHKPPKKHVERTDEVTVVGNQCFGSAYEVCLAPARRLAAIAGTELLSVRFSVGKHGPLFLSANAMPALTDPRLSQAVCNYLSN